MKNEIFVGCWSVLQKQKKATATERKRSRSAHYIKPQPLQEFENEYNAHAYDSMPNFPAYARVRTHFRDDTANGLTAAIIAHLQYKGHFAGRVNTTGIFDKRTGIYRQTSARKGMADISAVICGKPVQIEIKAGKDKPRADQIKVQAEYEAAGGIYIFVHNFTEYLEQYKTISNE